MSSILIISKFIFRKNFEFLEKSPFFILILLSSLCGLLFAIFLLCNVNPILAASSSIFLLSAGQIWWNVLLSPEGINSSKNKILFSIKKFSRDVKYRLYIVYVYFGFLLLLSILSLLFSPFQKINNHFQLIFFMVGILFGFFSILFIPNSSLTLFRNNINILFNIIIWGSPFALIPILFSPTDGMFWGCFSSGFSTCFLICQHYKIKMNFQENLSVARQGIPEETEELIEKLEFPGIKVLLLDIFGQKNVEKTHELPVEILREMFLNWFAERNYSIIVKVGHNYLNKFQNKINLIKKADLSYTISSIYVKSLLRIGSLEEAEKVIESNFGNKLTKYLLNNEKANLLWEKNDTETAINLIKETLIEIPTCTSSKNCLAFYLTDSASLLLFNSKASTDKNIQIEYFEKAKSRLEQAEKLLNEISFLSKIKDKKSYFYSNNGYYKMVNQEINWGLPDLNESISARENPRARIGLGMIHLIKNLFVDARYHFTQALADIASNRNCRYYRTASSFLLLINFFIDKKIYPKPEFIYCINKVYENSEVFKSDLNLENLLSIIPEKFFRFK